MYHETTKIMYSENVQQEIQTSHQPIKRFVINHERIGHVLPSSSSLLKQYIETTQPDQALATST